MWLVGVNPNPIAFQSISLAGFGAALGESAAVRVVVVRIVRPILRGVWWPIPRPARSTRVVVVRIVVAVRIGARPASFALRSRPFAGPSSLARASLCRRSVIVVVVVVSHPRRHGGGRVDRILL